MCLPCFTENVRAEEPHILTELHGGTDGECVWSVNTEGRRIIHAHTHTHTPTHTHTHTHSLCSLSSVSHVVSTWKHLEMPPGFGEINSAALWDNITPDLMETRIYTSHTHIHTPSHTQNRVSPLCHTHIYKDQGDKCLCSTLLCY